jgi:hypothetical protein
MSVSVVFNFALSLDGLHKCSRRGPNVMKCYWRDPGRFGFL